MNLNHENSADYFWSELIRNFHYKSEMILMHGSSVELTVFEEMKLITAVVFCVLVSCSYAIHNGRVVEPNSVPYQVLLLVKRGDKTSKCGGSLIKADRVLTAGKNLNFIKCI